LTKKKAKEIGIIFLLSVVIFLSKWMPIYFLDFDFLPKLINFSTDIQYFPPIKSFSLLEFKNGFSYNETAEKITTFPFSSIIWHVLLYNIFSNYTFLILEFIFKFIQALILYLIFKKIYKSSTVALIITLFLFLFLFSLNLAINIGDVKYLITLQNLFDGFFGLRFPRPLVTSVYFLLFIYFVILLRDNFNKNLTYKNLAYIALALSLLINSFFYFFVSCLLLMILIFKDKIKYLLIRKKKKLLFFFLLILIGSTPFIFQAFYGEKDFSLRQGLININLYQKIYLTKYLIKSFCRIEFALILLINLLIFKFYKQNNLLKIFFFFYLSNIFSTFIFIIFSPKVISLYQFIDLIVFSGLFYLLLVIVDFLNNKLISKKKIYKKDIIHFILIFITVCFVYFDSKLEINLKVKKLIELDKINKILVNHKSINSRKILFTNDIDISALWILSGNKFMSVTNGFHNSFKDDVIETQLFSSLKNIYINTDELEQILNFRSNFDKRNFLITFLFMNKYQANNLHTYSASNNYDVNEIIEIQKTSPLRVQNQIIPANEKQRLINKYSLFINDKHEKPDLIILNKKDIISKIIEKKVIHYKIISSDDLYITLIKNN
jgi:hypothetical protein